MAGTVSGLRLNKSELIRSIAENVTGRAAEAIYGETAEFMNIYRKRSVLIGQEITWEDRQGRHAGIAADINEKGNLEVDEDGSRIVLMSGEVSVRKA